MRCISYSEGLLASLMIAVTSSGMAVENQPLNIDNPIVLQRADPWIYRDPASGCYQFIGSSPGFDQIEIRSSCRINDLKLAEPAVIWKKKDAGPMSANIWAPELHRIDDVWYVYFAAGDVEILYSYVRTVEP